MKKLMVSLMAVAALAAPAYAGGARVESFDYTGVSQVGTEDYSVWAGPICVEASDACLGGASNVRTLRGERMVSVKIVDDSGASVKGIVVQKGIEKEFCNSSGRVPIKGGKPIAIYVSGNPCAATPDGVPTTGTVTVKFFD